MMFIEFIGVALDQLTTQAATMRYLSRGSYAAAGGAASAGAGPGVRLPALPDARTLVPRHAGPQGRASPRARTAYGLLRSAIGDDDPVVFLEPRVLYAEREEYEFDRRYRLPLGKARDPSRARMRRCVVAAARWCARPRRGRSGAGSTPR